jgi:hypothetical protein
MSCLEPLPVPLLPSLFRRVELLVVVGAVVVQLTLGQRLTLRLRLTLCCGCVVVGDGCGSS